MPARDADLHDAWEAHRSGRLAEAEAGYMSVLGREPDHPDALRLLGSLAFQLRQYDRAVDLLRLSLRLQPASAEAFNTLGAGLEARGQFAKAENAYRRSLRLDRAYVEAWSNLGTALRKQARFREASDCHRAALKLRPDHPPALEGLAVILSELGRNTNAVRLYRRLVTLEPESPARHSDLLQALQHEAGETPQSLFDEARRWSARHELPHLAARRPHANDPTPHRRLRVGYVSPDFRDHPVGRLLYPVLAHHDRAAAVEVYCYADVRLPDWLTRDLRALADVWRDAIGESDERLAELIRADRIDVLVDCAGHFGGNRLPAFARRPAPVQVTHFGYCATTGLSAMDYRLTDAHSDPPGATERHHAEQLVRLPDCWWCYRPPDDPPPVGPVPAVAAGHVTFGCLNRANKVGDPVVELWSRILLSVPGSRLLLLSGAADNPHLLRRFGRHGVGPGRIELATRRPRPQYLALHDRIDVNLDPFPYNGDNTICDGFLMGVPCVALAGHEFRSRRGLSHLRAIGLPELVAETPDDYLAIAVRLAFDLPRLAELRRTLRARLQGSPLCDAATYTRNLEAAYRNVWQRWCGADRTAEPRCQT